jgi:hypothetical protein
MDVTLNLEPKLFQRLQDEAQQQGLPLEQWLQHDLEKRFKTKITDAGLLEIVTAGLPESFWVRYRALIKLRQNNQLNHNEHQELILLSDQAEALTLRRTKALIELAQRRGISPESLREQLALKPVSLES